MNRVEIRDETIFTLLRLPAARSDVRDWWILAALTVIGWLGAVAFLGRFRPNQVARTLYAVASPEILSYAAVALALASAAALAAMRRRELAGTALMVAAFLVGHRLFPLLNPLLPARLFPVPFRDNGDAVDFVAGRLAYAAALAVPMLAAWWIAFGGRGGWPRLALGIGDFTIASRDVSAKTAPMTAWRSLVTGFAFFCLILFVVMQANVLFGPVRTGTLWPLLPAVLLAALGNSLAEEVVFRGLIMPAFVRGGGLAAGLWMQGLMFGLMHWGMSVGILAALPLSLLIGLGSVIFGKIAIDTGGLGWTVAAHAMIDVCVMSAFFVPRG